MILPLVRVPCHSHNQNHFFQCSIPTQNSISEEFQALLLMKKIPTRFFFAAARQEDKLFGANMSVCLSLMAYSLEDLGVSRSRGGNLSRCIL